MKRRAGEEVCESAGKKACIVSVAETMVRPSEVPEYLRESEFYKSLNTEDDEEFYVPANLMKSNMNVETMQDAGDLLHTIRFWGLDVVPKQIALFALTQPFKAICTELAAFEEEFPYLETLLCALDERNSLQNRIEAAMELGVVEIVRHLHKSSDFSMHMYTARAIGAAATNGHVECLEQALPAHQKASSAHYSMVMQVYAGAVKNGHLRCVELLNERYITFTRLFPIYVSQKDVSLPSIAAAHNQYDCLQYMHDQGCHIYNCEEAAASSGSLRCLQFIVQNKRTYPTRTPFAPCLAAAKHGHFECLKYLHEQKYSLANNLCKAAATGGNALCLAYAHSHRCEMRTSVGVAAASVGSLSCLRYFFENGGVWSYEVCHAAALNGHLNCLQYAYERGCPVMPAMLSKTLRKQFQKRYAVSKGPAFLAEHTAMHKHWSCVLYLILQGCPLTRGLTAQLARKHKDSILQLAVERGCEVATEVGVRYAKVGNLEGLKFALEHGCDPSPCIPAAAARRGHLQCLVCAHQQGGCQWSEEVCVAAARGGHLDCLQYAREHGCPWDYRVRLVAKKQGHEEIVRYADENGCPEFVDKKVGMQLR